MTTSSLLRAGNSGPTILRARDVKLLGSVPGRGQFIEHRGTEYQLSAHDANPAGMSRRATFVATERFLSDESGGRVPSPSGAAYQLATPMPSGTYARLLAERDAKALGALRFMRGDALTPVWGQIRARGVGPALAYLKARGVLIGIEGDRLEAYLQKGRGGHLYEAIRLLLTVGAPLVRGHLQGQPPACELQHGKDTVPALTVTLGGALVCEEHLDQDVATDARKKKARA
jgi:hypothetical protein